jgi:hypothetical protein
MKLALWVECPAFLRMGLSDHLKLDFCTYCYPYREMYPVCPHDRARLKEGHCNRCNTDFDLSHPRVLEIKGQKQLLVTPRKILAEDWCGEEPI